MEDKWEQIRDDQTVLNYNQVRAINNMGKDLFNFWCNEKNMWVSDMKQIEITDDIVLIVAAAEFEKHSDKTLDEMPNYICADWENEARNMLTAYNRVVEILSEWSSCAI